MAPRVVVFASDSSDSLRHWGGMFDAVQARKAEPFDAVFCHDVSEVQQALEDLRRDHKQLHAIVTDDSMSAFFAHDGTELFLALRKGRYGDDIAHTPVALVTGGAPPSHIHAINPPPVILGSGRLNEGILGRFLGGEAVPEAYNSKQLQDYHMGFLIAALKPPDSCDPKSAFSQWFQQICNWIQVWKKREVEAPKINDRHTYQQWFESLPPLEQDRFMQDRIEFIKFSFENAFLDHARSHLVFSKARMRELQDAVRDFEKSFPYIPNDRYYMELCKSLSEVKSMTQKYFGDDHGR